MEVKSLGPQEGKTEAEAGDTFWPSSSQLDTSKLKMQFVLVGDKGVYLLTNANLGKDSTPRKSGQIVYAKGCNPDVDAYFYENKEEKFGVHDGTISFQLEWLTTAIAKKKGIFRYVDKKLDKTESLKNEQ